MDKKRWWWKKSIVLSVISIENSKTFQFHTFFNEILAFSSICNKCSSNNEKIFEEESIEIYIEKILD